MREPQRPRVFRTPLWWLVGSLAVAGCLYLFANLPLFTQTSFLVWNAAGLVVYFAYSRRGSRLAQA
jgi:APA family basic amino acid/polyamine antiporter